MYLTIPNNICKMEFRSSQARMGLSTIMLWCRSVETFLKSEAIFGLLCTPCNWRATTCRGGGTDCAGVGGVGGKGCATNSLVQVPSRCFFYCSIGLVVIIKKGQKVAVGRNLLPSIQPRSALTKWCLYFHLGQNKGSFRHEKKKMCV